MQTGTAVMTPAEIRRQRILRSRRRRRIRKLRKVANALLDFFVLSVASAIFLFAGVALVGMLYLIFGLVG